MAGRLRDERADLEREHVPRAPGVARGEAVALEIAILVEVVRRRIGEEHECGIVVLSRRVEERPLPVEESGEHFAAGFLGTRLRRAGEVMPPEVHETVLVLLMVVDDPGGRVERDLEGRGGRVPLEVQLVPVAGRVFDLAEAEEILAVIAVVERLEGARVERHGILPHVRDLPRRGTEESPGAIAAAQVERLTIAVVRSRIGRGAHVKCADGNARGDIHDRRVAIAVFRVPAAGDERDAIDDGRIEQLIEASGDPRIDGNAVEVVRVFRVLPADVYLSRGRARRAGDRLLQDLRRRVRGRAVVLILLEDLYAAARVDRDRHGGRHGDRLQGDGDRGHLEGERDVLSVSQLDRAVLRAKADQPHEDGILPGLHVVDHEPSECVGEHARDDLLLAGEDADLRALQRLASRGIGDGPAHIGVVGIDGSASGRGGEERERQARGEAGELTDVFKCSAGHGSLRAYVRVARRRTRMRLRRKTEIGMRRAEPREARHQRAISCQWRSAGFSERRRRTGEGRAETSECQRDVRRERRARSRSHRAAAPAGARASARGASRPPCATRHTRRNCRDRANSGDGSPNSSTCAGALAPWMPSTSGPNPTTANCVAAMNAAARDLKRRRSMRGMSSR